MERRSFVCSGDGRIFSIDAKRNTRAQGKLSGSEAAVFDPTFDDLEICALGELGLTISYFYSLTPRQFDNHLTGYRKKEENKDRTQWEIARLQMYYSVVASQGSEKIKVKDILQFPWETSCSTSFLNKKPKTQKELAVFWESVDKKKH
mgnify:FL=1